MKTDNSQSVKRWLQRYGEAARDSAALDARAANARARAEMARTSHLDGMPHVTGYAGDSLGTALARIDELEAEAQASRAHAVTLYHEIDAAVKQITGPGWPDMRAVLRVRYLDLEPWEGVAEVLFGQRDDYEEKADSFLRRVHKIHGAALGKLTNIVPLDEGQEITYRKDDRK